MVISITKLRSNLYKLIDQVIETGIPVTINRNGVIVKITAEKPKSKFSNLPKHPGVINGDPEDLVHSDWSKTWKGKKLP
jgi:prevent-host-death family protein